MSHQAHVFFWMCVGAVIGLIFAWATANQEILGSLRSYGFPDFGYFFSIVGGAIIGGFAAMLRNWWQRER